MEGGRGRERVCVWVGGCREGRCGCVWGCVRGCLCVLGKELQEKVRSVRWRVILCSIKHWLTDIRSEENRDEQMETNGAKDLLAPSRVTFLYGLLHSKSGQSF